MSSVIICVVSGTAQRSEARTDFLLERMRFKQTLGWWMDDSMKEFVFTRSIQAESYEQNDLKQYARRIHEQGHIIDEQSTAISKMQTRIGNYEEIVKGQNDLIDDAVKRAEKERKRRIRGKRRAWVSLGAAFIGGIIIAK